MKVFVTCADIRNGKRDSKQSCPVALAVKRAAKTGEVTIGCRYASVRGRVVIMPYSVGDFVRNFDKRFPVEPFEFYIK